ncbi:hypothetical protein CDAR_61731 [Caerostris darwini]|uniref:Uncharacterized protein n=1 Tax=Caerostris darwini TaxID=1538125 RepID=A0AAV4VL33_9ARAC|nr:hypothetical protein CDAR_61731 [Caerostris darwini]
MIVQPTTEQYELGDNFLKPIVNFEQSQSQSSLLTSNEEIASVTIELRKPTIDQLLCYPTVEQYHLKDKIIKPTVYYRAYHSTIHKSTLPFEVNPTILIQFGKQY